MSKISNLAKYHNNIEHVANVLLSVVDKVDKDDLFAMVLLGSRKEKNVLFDITEGFKAGDVFLLIITLANNPSTQKDVIAAMRAINDSGIVKI